MSIRPASEGEDNAPTTDADATTTPAGQQSIEKAIELAAAAGRWDVVVQLGRVLEARQLAGVDNVVSLGVKRTKR